MTLRPSSDFELACDSRQVSGTGTCDRVYKHSDTDPWGVLVAASTHAGWDVRLVPAQNTGAFLVRAVCPDCQPPKPQAAARKPATSFQSAQDGPSLYGAVAKLTGGA